MKKLLFLTLFGLLGSQVFAQNSATLVSIDDVHYDQIAEDMLDADIDNVEPWGKQRKPTKAVLILDGDYIALGNITLVKSDSADISFYRGDKDTARVFPLYDERYSMSSGGVLQGADGEKLEAILITPQQGKGKTAWITFNNKGVSKNIEPDNYEIILELRPEHEDVEWASRGKYYTPSISSQTVNMVDSNPEGSYALSVKGKWGRKYGFFFLKEAENHGLVKTQVFEPAIDPHDPSTIHRFELKDGQYILDGKIKVKKLVLIRVNEEKATGSVKQKHDGRQRKDLRKKQKAERKRQKQIRKRVEN